MPDPNQLRAGIRYSVLAFRGYDVTNLGRTPDLLEHPAYGAIVEGVLRESSAVAADALRRPVDLVERVRRRQETVDLASYAEDLALIVAVELAQLRLLEQFFGISLPDARLAFGYSLGEPAALIAAGVFELQHLLPVPLILAEDSVALAHDVTMGVVFSRGAEIDVSVVERLCLEISQEGKGVIALSTHLSPNSLLVLAQRETLDRFKSAMVGVLPERTHVRTNPQRWPPLHTPIIWQRQVRDRAAVMLQVAAGGFTAPRIPILSCVTGDAAYDGSNSRALLCRWVDHPQQLWSVIYETLASRVHTVIHVGPAPNLIPATFRRLADNVAAQVAGYSAASLGRRAISHIARRPWLSHLLPSQSSLLRAPFVIPIILENWLLEQKV